MSYIECLPDDPPFLVDELEQRIAQAIKAPVIKSIFIVRIADWFAPRWLGFSGKVSGASAAASQELTVPPFAPSRVVSESYFFKDKGAFVPGAAPLVLHAKQTPSASLKRQVAEMAPETALFWFSVPSRLDPRAAFMAHYPSPSGGLAGSYFGFRVSDTIKVVARLSWPKDEKPLPFVRRAPRKLIRS